MRMQILKEAREEKEETQMEECKGKQKSIVEKEVIINVQEEQIDKLNDECNILKIKRLSHLKKRITH